MNRSLRSRITLALTAVTLALVVVAGAAVVSLARLGGAIDVILRENYRSVAECEAMNESLERLDSAVLFAATGHGEVARTMLATHRARFARAFAGESANVTLPGEGELVRALGARYGEYTDAVDQRLATARGAPFVDAYFTELLPRFTGLKLLVHRVSSMNQAAMESADRSARSLARTSTVATVCLVVAALAVALWLAWRLPRTIVRPLQTMADAARAVGAGDLDVAVDDEGVVELAPLVEAFRKMVLQLREYRQSSLGELLAAKDLANATVRCLVDPVVVLGDGGEVLLTNEAAARTFALRTGDDEALRAAEVRVPDAFARARDEVLATGRAVVPRSFAEALRWRDRAGERYFLVRAAPLSAEGEASRRVIVVAQDVTRLRRIDELKSDMVATVSHEFKTPLTSLRMATHLLLEPATGALSEAQREIVTTARDDTERLRALVDELLDLVRIETEAGELRRATIDPKRLLMVAAEAHRAIARDKGVALEVEGCEGVAPARLDVEKIGIVLANLVSNAVRHTPEGGRVTLGATSGDGALRISIRDTGEGVERDELARLLEGDLAPARTSAPGAGRHGLGLTIAKEIVLQHGGDLTAWSEAGRGSTFTVLLPYEEAHSEA